MDFYALLATLYTVSAVICGRRYTGISALLTLWDPRVGAYLAAELSEWLDSLYMDRDAIARGISARVGAYWSALKAAQCLLSGTADELDRTANALDFDAKVGLSCDPVVQGVLTWAESLHHTLSEDMDDLKSHGQPTLERLANPEWVRKHTALMSALDVGSQELRGAMQRLDDVTCAPDAPIQAPEQLTLDLPLPAPRPCPGTGAERCESWTATVYPPRQVEADHDAHVQDWYNSGEPGRKGIPIGATVPLDGAYYQTWDPDRRAHVVCFAGSLYRCAQVANNHVLVREYLGYLG